MFHKINTLPEQLKTICKTRTIFDFRLQKLRSVSPKQRLSVVIIVSNWPAIKGSATSKKTMLDSILLRVTNHVLSRQIYTFLCSCTWVNYSGCSWILVLPSLACNELLADREYRMMTICISLRVVISIKKILQKNVITYWWLLRGTYNSSPLI